jgi:hypothetical protein
MPYVHAIGIRREPSLVVAVRVLNRRVTKIAREASMRLAVCLTVGLILASAAQAVAQSDPQAYCVNSDSADFYPYTGEPCKSGYQLGAGNCRQKDGRMVAVSREQCAAMAGRVELPFEGGRRPEAPVNR